MIIYLVRHAEYSKRRGMTENEGAEYGLTEYGILQAKAAAIKIKKFGIEKIYSSPIKRARETAEIIGKEFGLPVEIDERLKEFFFDSKESDPAKQKELKKEALTHHDRLMPSGESYNQAILRFEEIIYDLGSRNYKKICLVTHRVVMEGLLAKKYNINSDKHGWIRPASVTALEQNNGELKVLFYDKKFTNLSLVLATLKRRFF